MMHDGRERTIESYAYLCARAARKFARPGIERADLQQIAAIGLIKAYDRYDCGLATPFEAFAWLFVVGELMHYVRDQERIVRPPRKLRDLERRCIAAQDDLVCELQREPTLDELAARLDVSTKTLAEVLRCRRGAVVESLDAVALHAVPSGTWPPASTTAYGVVGDALARLTSLERAIIVALYGAGYTQGELAARLGYSRRHVSRLHRAALRKMRPYCQKT